ncbi:RNA-binding protein 39-like isoform X2 [Orbicella faveolata]|uniref:RNA-binding protein 39-like isoform X2 n=1 Tax=Orbicella faveolata TaxID=48498 RepID=UPI0009E22512|nr:RNA-binding protein 39-like isoform X2 [Orbicella faveolata]XP_020609510.1 RNA-binding protein 39-like isoform X2 [Orbicella faveolata]
MGRQRMERSLLLMTPPAQANGSKSESKRQSSDGEERRKRSQRNRSRSRSPDRSRRRRSRSRSNSRERNRRRRSRSGGHERRRRGRSASGSRSRSRSPPDSRRRKSNDHRSRRERQKSASRSPSPSNRLKKEELEGSDGNRSPFEQRLERRELKPAEDITPEERDARTAFCMQLARNIRPRDLEEFFSKVGQVADVRIISDRNSRRSKGIAYVEFTDRSAVPLAINLSGQKLLGAPIMVMPTQAEKNRAAAEAEKLKAPPGPTRLYVGSLHFNINEQMIKAIFEPFGTVESVQMIYDSETGRSKGYGFLQFKDADAARQAMDQMNGFELAGRPMKVGPVTERGDSSSYSFLDDEEYEKGGVELNSTARAALMAKLSQGHSAGLSVPGVPAPAVGVQQAMATPVSIPLPTQCIMLLNMFDPTKEKDPDWDADIRDDVLEECTKYGYVYHIHVDKASNQGAVYVKCSNAEVAASASKALHGRWFAGKQIIARAIPLVNYHAMFPQAVSMTKPLQPSTF